jgi:hypothetical protein
LEQAARLTILSALKDMVLGLPKMPGLVLPITADSALKR